MKLEFRMVYLKSIYKRYRKSTIKGKGEILNEFCKVCGYNRKYAIRLLNAPLPERDKEQRKARENLWPCSYLRPGSYLGSLRIPVVTEIKGCPTSLASSGKKTLPFD